MDKILRTIDQLRVTSLSSSSNSAGTGTGTEGPGAGGPTITYPSSIPSSISYALTSAAGDGKQSKKKERIENCAFVTEALCSPHLQGSKDFPKILESIVQVLFLLCDDGDSDIRLVASDSLNRIVKCLKDSQLVKFQAEVVREIRRNGTPRSIKAALNIFAYCCPMIRPQKAKLYSQSLVPALVAISNRSEEILYEHLDEPLNKILKALGPYLPDPDMDTLIKAYIENLNSTSTIVRRSSARVLVLLAQNSRVPGTWVPKLLAGVMDLLVPNVLETGVPTLIGCLQSIKQIIPLTYKQLEHSSEQHSQKDFPLVVPNLLRIYELCLLLCHHDDHNVITTSLETLGTFLQNPPAQIRQTLISDCGIPNSFEQNLESAEVPKVRTGRGLGGAAPGTPRGHFLSTSSEDGDEVFLMANTSEPEEPDTNSNSTSGTNELSPSAITLEYAEPTLGSLYEPNAKPILYCARFLAYNFLLGGKPGVLRPDSEVRTTVKVLAVHSIFQLVKLYPQVYNLLLDTEAGAEAQGIADVILYSKHSDPLVRGTIYLLVGTLVEQGQGNDLTCLVSILEAGLQDASNLSIKYALDGIKSCSRFLISSDQLLELVFDLILNPYWVVKVGVIDLLSSLSLKLNLKLSKKIQSLLIFCLTDEDQRVRSGAISGLVKFIRNSSASIHECTQLSPIAVLKSLDYPIFSMPQSFDYDPGIENTLSSVIESLVEQLTGTNRRIAEASFLICLSALAESFSPKLYRVAWRLGISHKSQVNNVPWLLQLIVETLRNSPIVVDLAIHKSCLSLAGALFFGISDGDLENPDILSLGEDLVHHTLEIIKLYVKVSTATEGTNPKVMGHGTIRKFTGASAVTGPVTTLFTNKDKQSSGLVPSFISTSSFDMETESSSSSSFYPSHISKLQFLKIQESLQTSYRLTKSNLDARTQEKFESLLVTSLKILGEFPSKSEAYVLQSTFLQLSPILINLSPVATIQTGTWILRNLCAPTSPIELQFEDPHCCNFEEFWMQSFPPQLIASRHGSTYHPPAPLLPSGTLAQCIKSFEPLVIKSLRIYTSSSDPGVQIQILNLLCELVKGRINYALIDSNGGFLNHVLKQVSWLEEGLQQPGTTTPEALSLVGSMFEFFIFLEHERRYGTTGGGSGTKFIDFHKILCLLDSLVASGQNPRTHVLPAFRPVVYDLFIRQGQGSRDLDTQREVLFQMSMKVGAMCGSEIWPIWILILSARKETNVQKWLEESEYIYSFLNKTCKNPTPSLIALLMSLHPQAIPNEETLIANLNNAELNIQDLIVNWSLLGRSKFPPVTADLVLKHLSYIAENMKTFSKQELSYFYHSLTYALSKDPEKLQSELTDSVNLDLFTQLAEAENCTNSFLDLLRILKYPQVEIYNKFLPDYELEIMDTVLEGFEQRNVEWIIDHCSEFLVLQYQYTNDQQRISSFFNSLDAETWNKLISKLHPIEKKPELLKGLLIIMTETKVQPNGSIILSLLNILASQELPLSLSFELSSFLCFLFSTQNPITMTPQEHSSITTLLNQYQYEFEENFPRLLQLGKGSVGTPLVEDQTLKPCLFSLEQWCTELNPISSESEGLALCQVLNSLSYSQILKIFHQPKFNLRILEYPFRFLQQEVLIGKISNDDLSSLMGSQNHSSQLLERLPLGVGSYDFLLEILDKLEQQIEDKGVHHFPTHLPLLWPILSEVLVLRQSFPGESGQPIDSLSSPSSLNNYIPIPIFLRSFQYFGSFPQDVQIPINQFRSFLRFASATLSDTSFLWFWNSRDHDPDQHPSPQFILDCVNSLWIAVRRIRLQLGLDVGTPAAPSIGTLIQPNSAVPQACLQFLKQFNYLVGFLHSSGSGGGSLDPELENLLRSTIGGLARTELINGWLLVCHLGWKSIDLCFQDPKPSPLVFPTISRIPVEILSCDHELLLQYLEKLRLFGVGNKIQFEENWMTFCSVINTFGDPHADIRCISIGLEALSMMLTDSVKLIWAIDAYGEARGIRGLRQLDSQSKSLEPTFGRDIELPVLISATKLSYSNPLNVDLRSCTQFLIELFSQWFNTTGVQVPTTTAQPKIPLFLLSQITQSLKCLSDYFDEPAQWTWMYANLLELWKGFEKEDEGTGLWSTCVLGIFKSSGRNSSDGNGSPVDPLLLTILEATLDIGNENDNSLVGVKSALLYLQSVELSSGLWDPILEIVLPYLLGQTSLNEILNSTETQAYSCWELILFIWIHYTKSIGDTIISWESQILQNVQTILSPLNKVHLSIRLLVLKGLRQKVLLGNLEPETKRVISKMALEQLNRNTTPASGTGNSEAIFYYSLKLYLTIFYSDFSDFYGIVDPEPEVLMQMSERTEVLFKLLRSSRRSTKKLVSQSLRLIVSHFLPPSEILNRIIAELLLPSQSSPELIAPAVVEVFSKSRQKPKEAALVREWISSSLPNFLTTPDLSRSMWTLSLFWIGVSQNPTVQNLLPLGTFRRNTSLTQKLFNYSGQDYYSTLAPEEKEKFKEYFKNAYGKLGLGSAQSDGEKPITPRTHPYAQFLEELNNSNG